VCIWIYRYMHISLNIYIYTFGCLRYACMCTHTHTNIYTYKLQTQDVGNTYFYSGKDALQHDAAYCNILQYTTYLYRVCVGQNALQHSAIYYNTLHYTATHCNTLQHTATHHTASHLQHTATVEGSVSGYIIPLHALQKLQKHIVLFRLVCKLKEALEIEREPLCREYVPVEKDTCRAGCTATLCDVLQYIATLQHEDALNTLS